MHACGHPAEDPSPKFTFFQFLSMRTAPPPCTRYSTHDHLVLEVHETRLALGLAAARAAAAFIRDTISARGEARVIFACAPSQDEFLSSLVDSEQTGIAVNWSAVTAFHMDDYVGLSAAHSQSFRNYLQTHFLDRVTIGRFHPIEAEHQDLEAMCTRYESLLSERPIDLICLGIGENGHIAFNDPGVAEFEDQRLVKQVQLDRKCRQQQVNDGCFPDLDAVPQSAISLTIPVFRRARRLSIHVPGRRKADAVAAALTGEISPDCPASILRLHPHATLYVDTDAARALGT
jgi:glucosamine-6-phosphate deaminase